MPQYSLGCPPTQYPYSWGWPELGPSPSPYAGMTGNAQPHLLCAVLGTGARPLYMLGRYSTKWDHPYPCDTQFNCFIDYTLELCLRSQLRRFPHTFASEFCSLAIMFQSFIYWVSMVDGLWWGFNVIFLTVGIQFSSTSHWKGYSLPHLCVGALVKNHQTSVPLCSWIWLLCQAGQVMCDSSNSGFQTTQTTADNSLTQIMGGSWVSCDPAPCGHYTRLQLLEQHLSGIPPPPSLWLRDKEQTQGWQAPFPLSLYWSS